MYLHYLILLQIISSSLGISAKGSQGQDVLGEMTKLVEENRDYIGGHGLPYSKSQKAMTPVAPSGLCDHLYSF